MTISHGNISHHTHKGTGTEVCAHNHNGDLLLVLASFSKSPGTLDWNGTNLTNKINTGYDQPVPSSDVWWLANAEQGAFNLTMNNEGANYIYCHICIISIIGASSQADPFGETKIGAGTSTQASCTLDSCAATSRSYFVAGMNVTALSVSGGAGQTELWDAPNVDSDHSAGYWEDAEDALSCSWSGAHAWECVAVELEYLAPPTVTECDPDSGPIAGGTDVTLTGTEFRDGATVTFGGEDATDVVVESLTEITCDTPAHDEGLVDIVVTNDDAQYGTLEDGFEYTAGGAKSHSKRQFVGLI